MENQTNGCQDGGLQSLELAGMNLKCQQCRANTILQAINPKKICLRFNLIKNCIKYNRGSDFASSTLMCEQCQGNSFLNQKGECQDRSNSVQNCLKYAINKDQCEECQKNFFLDNTGLNCVANPSGLVGCAIYSSQSTCSQCQKDFYLSEGKCLVLSSNEKTVGCVAYNSQKQCIQCESSTSLVDQKCESNSVANCAVHETPLSCKECQPGFGISNVDDKNTCINLPNIPGCIQQSQFEPYLCDVCEVNQFLTEDGKCQQLDPNKQTPNCQAYGNGQLCVKCAKGYALSMTREKCFLIHENTNCEH